MTSTNEELPPSLKTRSSPVDFQNADLVSRLLAATPPYLYNMPVVPHSFFFSEMLRSLVQAKAAENSQRHTSTVHQRRPRKRSWTQVHAEITKPENTDVFQPMWAKSFPEKSKLFEEKIAEKPHHFPVPHTEKLSSDDNINDNKSFILPDFDKNIPSTSTTVPTAFPQPSSQSHGLNDLSLPSQPSVWYPPFYSNAYGIDPLHFFIDLRVSGHIYDKKNQKENLGSLHPQQTEKPPFPIPTSANQLYKSEASPDNHPVKESFKQTRHTSAFSVPRSVLNKNLPVNLTHYSSSSHSLKCTESKTKFDVKSMGFDKGDNLTGTSYIMKNVTKLYKKISSTNITKMEVESADSETQEQVDVIDTEKESTSSKIQSDDDDGLTEEEKEKRVKDLRALIGLELVVDYMKNAKPGQRNDTNHDSSSDLGTSDSPTLDVVDIHDDIETVY
ncbi:uncharacterized protein LOC108733814 [Agrilus planipennis]|uniref:Uncharacterized protein LOC108733814 n=1 Tax=Agrilus planipennis TaxID=224129 RepID=A0A1W4WJJ9_AGRPL|nr:uncharacterized protein LOC108733814 [Agrilus planipennis]XP_018320638.1 uncharacterized protein LOC108733814 [Agrilus planipennis]